MLAAALFVVALLWQLVMLRAWRARQRREQELPAGELERPTRTGPLPAMKLASGAPRRPPRTKYGAVVDSERPEEETVPPSTVATVVDVNPDDAVDLD